MQKTVHLIFTKLPRYHVLIILLLIATACGQKAKVKTAFTLHAGALFSGTALNGGFILAGTNGTDRFSLPMSSGSAKDVSLTLNKGEWTFYAMGWKGVDQSTLASGNFFGEHYCEAFTKIIDGVNSDINLILTPEKCNHPSFAGAQFKENMTVAGRPAVQFKRLGLVSCANFSTVVDADSNCTYSPTNGPGSGTSFRIALLPFANFPGTGVNPDAPAQRLLSPCIRYSDPVASGIADPKYLTDIRLPVGGLPLYGQWLMTYQDINCTQLDAGYDYSKGFGSALNPHASRPTSGGTISPNYSMIFVADNYSGAAHSALESIVPHIHCGATAAAYADCGLGTKANHMATDPTYGNKVDAAFEVLSDALGNKDAIAKHDLAKNAYWSHNGLYIISNNPGSSFNNHQIVFQEDTVTGSCSTSATALYNSTTKVITICMNSIHTFGSLTADLTTALSPNFIATTDQIAGNSVGTASAFISSIPSLVFGGGSDLQIQRRDIGLMDYVRELTSGGEGSMLYKRGYLTCASIPATGAEHFAFPDGFTMDIVFEAPQKVYPVSLPLIANQGNLFQKRLRIIEKGVPTAIFEFNCPSGGGAVAAKAGYLHLAMNMIENGQAHSFNQELYYDATNHANATIVNIQEFSDPSFQSKFQTRFAKLSAQVGEVHNARVNYQVSAGIPNFTDGKRISVRIGESSGVKRLNYRIYRYDPTSLAGPIALATHFNFTGTALSGEYTVDELTSPSDCVSVLGVFDGTCSAVPGVLAIAEPSASSAEPFLADGVAYTGNSIDAFIFPAL